MMVSSSALNYDRIQGHRGALLLQLSWHLQPNSIGLNGVLDQLQPNLKISAIWLRVNSGTSIQSNLKISAIWLWVNSGTPILALHCSSPPFLPLYRTRRGKEEATVTYKRVKNGV
ncbi:hypothetical protein MA16_Dca024572 [Dendrobium catenatum]|uniref:Uncharacterized protein n=1 Tax=Dendrobium catenatum TaxID=906689 RepID=A0A2I0X5L8_9ASPA|nr:hypothetical protein MA16_Dca024572 [Dendrobium catenatum]